MLLDGFTGATWKIAREDGRATLTIQPFARWSPEDTDAVTGEGAWLLAFIARDAQRHDINVTAAG